MGLDRKRWRPSPDCLGHLSLLVCIINQRGLQSYKRPGAFHMFTFTKVQLLMQRGCEAGIWGCRGKITTLKKNNELAGHHGQCGLGTRQSQTHSAFSSGHMSPSRSSKLTRRHCPNLQVGI